MKSILIQALEKIYRKALHSFLNSKLIRNQIFYEEANSLIKKIEINLEFRENDRILNKLQSCGEAVKINGKLIVSDPRSVCIGNNVHIGDNILFASQGGLTIGDNTHISRNVTIYTLNHNYHGERLPYDEIAIPKPVSIGKNVWIGTNVCILPGISIGDGAIIGMGTTVTQDVPPLAIIGNQPSRILKSRNIEHYEKLEQTDSYGGVNGQQLLKETIELLQARKANQGENLFFVVTTGRSGSTTISALLSQHSKITCLHEPRPQLIRLSTDFAHKQKSYKEVTDELQSIYCNSSVYPLGLYGESDQKLFNLIEIISNLLPLSKFIWLIRDGRDVVASTYNRGWFNTSIEKVQGNPTGTLSSRWIYYRLNGEKTGHYNESDWQSLSVFERNCWYWSTVNICIEKQLSKLLDQRWMMIRLESLPERWPQLLDFLSVNQENLEVLKLNAALRPNKYWSDWSSDERLSFSRLCGKEMSKWYSSWEQDFIIESFPE
jgi:acetyltransferase-like isoleucine patch superfamily enzyme